MKSLNHKWQERITERTNPASASLDTKSTREILRIMNREDHRVAPAVRKTLPQIARAVDLAVEAIRNGGRLVYLGAGTSGRLGVLDASECVPTFGTDSVVAILAGAPASLTSSVEGVEDDPQQAVRDLKKIRFTRHDLLVGISASGGAPYVLGGMRYARKLGAKVVGLTCNPEAPLKALADVTIIPVVGPEVIAGSSRMKAGTAQKLVLNMLSTATMVRLGRVLSNSMINVQLTNQKLWKRAEGILMQAYRGQPGRGRQGIEGLAPQPARGAFDDIEEDPGIGSCAPASGRAERGGGLARSDGGSESVNLASRAAIQRLFFTVIQLDQ